MTYYEPRAILSGEKGSACFPLAELEYKSRVIYLTGFIDDVLAVSIVRQISVLERISEEDPYEIIIDSPGGDVGAAFAIYDAIKLSKPPCITTVINSAYSSAVIVFLAGEIRRMYPHARLFLHPVQVNNLNDGTYIGAYLAKAEYAVAEQSAIISTIIETTGKDEDTVNKWVENETFFNQESAVENLLANCKADSL